MFLLAVLMHASPLKAQSMPTAQAPLGLDVSRPAAKRLAGARDFVAAENWDAAIKSLDLLTEDFGASLIEVEPARYLSVRRAVSATLAGLPPPGLAAYRRRIDPVMKSLFAEAEARHSRSLMEQIVRDGLASSYGEAALEWLAEEALERGDTNGARRDWTTLLPVPPGAEAAFVLRSPDARLSHAEVCARLVICSILERDHIRADREIEAFKARFGDEPGSLAGRSGALGELLTELLAESRDWPATDAAAHRPNAVESRSADLATIVWQRALDPDRSHGIPAVWQDAVILPGADSVCVLSLSDGAPRWPSGAASDDGTVYAETVPGGDAPPAIRFVERNRCAVDEHRCYVRIGTPNSKPRSETVAVGPTRIVCLDLEAEGRVAWSVGSDELAEFPGGTFTGTPLLSGDRVYVTVRWGAPQRDVGLACLSADTGALLWNRRLCAAVEPGPGDVASGEEDVLAAGGGLVFQLPAGGIVAASDARTGELQWAATYPVAPRSAVSESDADATNALVSHGGWLFAKPRDADQLMAFDAGDGRLLWSVDPPGRIDELLGVSEGRLIAAGDQLWGFEEFTGGAWRFGFDDPEGYGSGRGAVAGGYVYWPTHEELFVVEARSGRLIERVLIDPGSGVGGGNVVVAGEGVIIAGRAQISAVGPPP